MGLGGGRTVLISSGASYRAVSPRMSNAEAIKRKLVETAKPVDAFIDGILQPRRPKVLYEASRHLILAGGKKLRPFLTVKACEAVGGSPSDAIPFASALEILHNFTLVHDDVMDNDPIRRAAPTVHMKWGVPIAIAAGDLLFAKVFEAMTTHAPTKMSAKRVKLCVEIAIRATIELCEGQVLDVSFPRITDVSEDDYLFMVGGKTSALFRACAEIGATVGCGKLRQVKALGRFGWDAGIAFQIMDDYLGANAEEKTLGKPVGSDLREGKKTLIIIHALRNARPGQRDTILSVLGNASASTEAINSVKTIINKIGSLEYALKKADRYTSSAKKYLNTIPDTTAKKDLLDLVDYFTRRQY